MEPFVLTLQEHYLSGRRDLPWRSPHVPELPDGRLDPYHILISECMLQQTQVGRVIPKFGAFLEVFPTIQALASAPLAAVLQQWSGLGYNRRARYLHEAAKQLQSSYPVWTIDELVAQKGIGRNTASAICAYAYNQPQVFIETNIRSVFIHHFFADGEKVADAELLPLVKAAMELFDGGPRDFYWALMDYGSFLKQQVGNSARQSSHYRKQSVFAGSRRQLRGRILKQLLAGPLELSQLAETCQDERLEQVVAELAREGLVKLAGKRVSLP